MTEPLTRAERRALLRRHHPDLGGDPEQFVAVMQAIGRLGDDASGPVRGTGPTRGVATASWGRRRRSRVLTSTRAALPRRLPGARRYAQL